MNARGVILGVGTVMVTAGVLIEVAGYVGGRTAAGQATNSYISAQPPASGAQTRESVPAPATATTRPAQATAEDPYLAVHYLYRAVANGSATGCAVFSPAAAQQFAAHFNAPDCPAAIQELSTKVTSPIKYALTGRRSPDVYLGDTMTISCSEIQPEGGPPLGRFILHRTDQDKWYISETEEC